MRRLIESGAVLTQNFVQIGLRGYWPPEEVWQWMQRAGNAVALDGRDLGSGLRYSYRGGDRGGAGRARVHLPFRGHRRAGPGFAPGTGTPEPGGILPSQLLRAMRRIVSRVNVVAMDLVEVSPPYDDAGAVTAEQAHRVVLEVITALALKRVKGGQDKS